MNAGMDLQTTTLETSVVELVPVRTVGSLDQAVLLLTYDQISREARTLECPTDVLREIVLDADADVVAFVPDHVVEPDLTPMIAKGCAALACDTVAAYYAPVTDAVKEISGGIVVGPVDRSTLAWVRGPAFVPKDLLLAALEDVPTPTVRPLTVVAGVVADFTVGRL